MYFYNVLELECDKRVTVEAQNAYNSSSVSTRLPQFALREIILRDRLIFMSGLSLQMDNNGVQWSHGQQRVGIKERAENQDNQLYYSRRDLKNDDGILEMNAA